MNKIYIIIIAILLIILFITNIFKDNEKDILIEKPLQENESFSINTSETKENTIIIQERQEDNSVKAKEIFIPEESKFEVITSSTTNKNEIEYDTKGFTLVPNINISYTNQISLGLGIRFFYWNEFGAVTHINYFLEDKNVSFSIGIDYRLYKLKLKNIAIGLSYDTHKSIKGQINLYLN